MTKSISLEALDIIFKRDRSKHLESIVLKKDHIQPVFTHRAAKTANTSINYLSDSISELLK